MGSKDNLGVKILNKSIQEKQTYYMKLINTLHDVIQHLGIEPDKQYWGALQLSKALDDDDVLEVTNLTEFEEFRLKEYSRCLIDVIKKNISKVSNSDLIKLIEFQREHSGTDEYFDDIVYKSEECKECQENVEEKTPKVVKTPLGQYTKEE